MTKILLAEDDDSLRSFLTSALRRAGHEVQSYEDGDTALSALEREVFDLLLTDIQMPGIDGIELARRGAELDDARRVRLEGVAHGHHSHELELLRASLVALRTSVALDGTLTRATPALFHNPDASSIDARRGDENTRVALRLEAPEQPLPA